jgi:hypothetical protein
MKLWLHIPKNALWHCWRSKQNAQFELSWPERGACPLVMDGWCRS